MDIEKGWTKALKNTEVIRTRIQALITTGDTTVSYILLSESSINMGNTVVREGGIIVQKPALILPPNNPQFNGFEFDGEEKESIDENLMINFLLVRGINIPSFRYDNKTSSLDVYDGSLTKAIKYYKNILQKKEDVHTGLLVGPEDFWQFSLLIFICMQIAKNAEGDVRRLLEEYKRKKKG